MRKIILALSVALVLAGSGGPLRAGAASSPQELFPADLDRLLAPVALYPDQLLAQILLCSTNPASVTALDAFLKKNAALKGTDLQDAVLKADFEPSFVALALFPQIVQQMAAKLDLTTQLGTAFKTNKALVFESIQRLRLQAKNAGNLKTTPQQEVETQTTASGQQVIVIEPANPQVVYVPQYNPTVVYTQPTTVVVQESSSSADAAVAGLIGFTAGIAIGAAIDNNYYYGPYGLHGGGYMYNDAWDDYYDHREDAREDWQDHREDLGENRSDRAADGPGKAHRRGRARAQENSAPSGRRSATGHGRKRDEPIWHVSRDHDERARRMSPAVTARPRIGASRRRRPRTAAARVRTRSPATRAESRSVRRAAGGRAAEAARVRVPEAAAGGGDDDSALRFDPVDRHDPRDRTGRRADPANLRDAGGSGARAHARCRPVERG